MTIANGKGLITKQNLKKKRQKRWNKKKRKSNSDDELLKRLIRKILKNTKLRKSKVIWIHQSYLKKITIVNAVVRRWWRW